MIRVGIFHEKSREIAKNTTSELGLNPLWSHARAPLRKDGKSVCTAICKWFIFKSVWPKVEQNRPIKQSKIKYDLVFMDWMDWCSYNRSRYEVKVGWMRKTWDQFNGPCLKCNCLATLVRRTFPAIWVKIEKYVLVFMPIFQLCIIHFLKKKSYSILLWS